MSKFKVCYVWDENLIDQCDRLPAVAGRAKLVHNLIEAYGLINKVQVVRSAPVSYEALRVFHSEIYLDHIKKFTAVEEEYISNAQDEEFGIGYDCPAVSNMFELVSTLAGGTVTAARCLVLGITDVAINWCGGWHHAQRFGAAGFCYVNDIVIAIEELRKKFPKVLYIDLDAHHGNGVQDAYNLSKSVFTLSFHKYEPGFYPGTGGLQDIGSLVGTGYSCNVPLKAGYCDDTFEYVFKRVFELVYSRFNPDAVVVQCGADALCGDGHGGAALTARGYGAAVRTALLAAAPTLLLGGGGYNFPNTARLWASLTALATRAALPDLVPEHAQWPRYGPHYTLHITPSVGRDYNTIADLDNTIAAIKHNLDKHLSRSSHSLDDCEKQGPHSKQIKTDSLSKGNNLITIRKNDDSCDRSADSSIDKIVSKTVETKDVYDFIE